MTSFHQNLNSFSREVTAFFDDFFKDTGLATSYIELLIKLYTREGLTQKVLAEELNFAPSTITRFIGKLNKMNLITKSREGREMKIELTPRGKTFAKNALETYQTAEAGLHEALGEKYVVTTGKLMEHGISLMKEK